MLPIQPHLATIVQAVRERGAAVVVAPPGSGKTTGVPPALIDGGVTGRVLVTQPRRVAARLVASHMARLRGSPLGAEVGFATRFERKSGPSTRIELVTEGILLRRLQADPFLTGVGCVILDEFHERTVDVDLALALLAEVRREVRPGLGVVVMSATLDPAPVAAFLDGVVVEAPGRSYPVEIQHVRRGSDRPVGQQVASAVRRVLDEEARGHVLAFLPGVREIEEARRDLMASGVPNVLPLHGRLSGREQDRVFSGDQARKVVLATNIAETSVTLDGVAAVVDSGLARAPAWDPAAGATRLELREISRASAEQRAGRAGRTGPGRCLRLWTEAEHRGRRPRDPPALHRSDLAGVLLQILAWSGDPEGVAWFKPPPPSEVERATALLAALGATEGGGLTAIGRALATLPLPPRLGRMLIEGTRHGIAATAATAAALIAERDPWPRTPPGEADFLRDDLGGRLAAFAAWEAGQGSGDRRALAEVQRVRDQLLRLCARLPSLDPPVAATPALPASLLAAFPDRVAQRRGDRERLLTAGGSGARLARDSKVDAPLLLALVLQGGRRGQEPLVRMATPLQEDWLPVERVAAAVWDPEKQAVVARTEDRVGALVLRSRTGGKLPPAAAALLCEQALLDPERALQPSAEAAGLLDRWRFVAAQGRGELPEPPTWAELLPGLCLGRRSFAELRSADLKEALLATLPWPQRQQLLALAPASLTVPSGRSVRLDYSGPAPVLAARIQQLFGWAETPRVCGVPVTVHLLAPNGRPQQVTADLASFWATGYPEVRKELRGRYPKHPWPEDPTTAPATDRARRRR